MATAIFPVALIIIGGALYFVSANPKVQEIGRILLAAGAFALAFLLAQTKLAI